MQQAKGNGVAPLHRDGFQQGVDVLPILDSHHNVFRVLALVEHVDAEKIKVNDLDLRMILPEVVPKLVQVVVPAPADQEKIFSV